MRRVTVKINVTLQCLINDLRRKRREEIGAQDKITGGRVERREVHKTRLQ